MKKRKFRFFKETKKTLSSLWFMLRLSWGLGKSRFFWTPFTIIINSLILRTVKCFQLLDITVQKNQHLLSFCQAICFYHGQDTFGGFVTQRRLSYIYEQAV